VKIPSPREFQLIARNLVRIGLLQRLSEPPIVIGGCGRSGTTLLLSVLAAHPRIFAVPVETHCFCPTAYTRNPDFSTPLRVREFYRLLLRSRIPASAVRWCEKTPRNVQYFGPILRRFRGKVRLIHVVRDGRDVITSKHPDDREGKYHVSPRRWVQDVRAGLRFEGHPQVLTLKYEDLVGSMDDTLDRIGCFLGESFAGLQGRWHEETTVKSSNAWWTDVRPVSLDSVGRWRRPRYRERVEEMMKLPDAVELLRDLGYLT